MTILTEAEYWELHHRLDHASYSDLVSFERNPRVYSLSKKRKVTDLMIQGSLLDCLLLAPSELDERFAVLEFDDLKTKAAREQKAAIEASGKTMIRPQWVRQAQQEIATIFGETTTVPAPRDILRDGRGQIAIRQRFDTIWFLSKPDWAPARHTEWGNWLIDLKRTSVDDMEDWGAKVASYRYHWQAASQLDAYNTEFPDDQRTQYGWLIITEHDCGLLACDQEDIELGRTEYVRSLQRYKTAFDNNEWPSPFHSVSGAPRVARIPEWYRRRVAA